MPSFEQKMAELNQLKRQVNTAAQAVNSKAQQVQLLETQVRQNQTPNDSAQQLDANMRGALGPILTPGNIGDINSVIWPYYFTTDVPDTPLGADETFLTGFSVTQEAAFIMMSYTKSVYLVDGEEPNQTYTYLNPDMQQPSAPGLVFTLRDGSSSRQFYNTPMNMDHYANPRFPTKLPRPVMFLPNQVVQIAFTNRHESNLYIPMITAFGYRIRIDQAQNLLSLVHG